MKKPIWPQSIRGDSGRAEEKSTERSRSADTSSTVSDFLLQRGQRNLREGLEGYRGNQDWRL